MKHNRTSKKVTRYEAIAKQKEKVAYYQTGKGLYVFRNNTRGSLSLAKPSHSGEKTIQPNQEWIGDDYFMNLVRTNEARLVREIEPAKEDIMEEKLILDQPAKFTQNGTVEHIVSQSLQTNEIVEEKEDGDRLLTEDPLEGVEILLS